MKKQLLVLTLAGALAMSALTGCGSFNGDAVALEVGDTNISADLANFYARYTQAQYETYYKGFLGEDMWTQEITDGETYEETTKKAIQESLENMVILEQHMDEYQVSVSDDEKAKITEAAKKFVDANESEDDKKLVSADQDTVERALTLMTIQQKMTDAIGAKADMNVTDDEAAQKSMEYVFFSTEPSSEDSENSETEIPEVEKEMLRAQAETVVSGLNEGQDFAELAQNAGVEVQTATFDSSSTSPDGVLITAADVLQEGGVTGVVEGTNGFYVARVTSLLDREATDTKKDQIVQERKNTLYSDTLKGWRDEAKITVNKNVWKSIDFQKLVVTFKAAESEENTEGETQE